LRLGLRFGNTQRESRTGSTRQSWRSQRNNEYQCTNSSV